VTRHNKLTRPVEVDGLRIDAAAEVLLACARDLGELDLVVVIDSALHAGDVSMEELTAIGRLRRRGAPRLRRVIERCDGRSESAWESLLRELHRACGIEVEAQHDVVDDTGGFVARGDLWLVGTCVLHEYDGGEHLKRARQRKDRKRDRRLGHAEWMRRGYTKDDVLHQGVTILRDADLSLGREHDPSRIRVWHALLRDSLFTPAGTAAFRQRVGLPPERGQSAA